MSGKVRALLFILILMMAATAGVPAAGIKYYPVSSAQWRQVDDICRIAGVAGPTSFGPVTGEELMIALTRAEKVLGSENTLVSDMMEELCKDNAIYKSDFGFLGISASVSPELYIRTDDSGSDTPFMPDGNWVIKKYIDRKPFVSASLEAGFRNLLYGKFELVAKIRKSYPNYWNSYFSTNIPIEGFVQNFPFTAGISMGIEGFSIIIARDRVSLGEGRTGNTAIGDVFSYQDFFRGGYSGKVFSTHINITYFDSSHVDPLRDHKPVSIWDVYSSSFSGWKQLRHTVDYEFVAGEKAKINLALIGLLDTDSGFDLRMLNPFMIFHSMFNFHESTILEANNMISLDLSWAFLPKWNFYAQITMDQYQMPGEAEGYYREFGYTDPNAFGGLVNLSYTDSVGKGILGTYLEFVLNMPGMYLNQKYYKDGRVTQYVTEERCWSQDYLVGNAWNDFDDMAFAGYAFGPDCIVAALGARYSVYGKYDLSARVQYLAHGEKGRGSAMENYDYSGMDDLQTINRMPLEGEEVEHSFSIALEADYSVLDWLSVYLGLASVYKINSGFSGTNSFDAQFSVGLTMKAPI